MPEAKITKGYRLPADLVEQVETWAQEHEVTQAEAVRRLLTAALAADEGEGQRAGQEQAAEAELVRELREHVISLKAQVSAMTAQAEQARQDAQAQLTAKDEQLRAALGLADHAQQLQAAQAKQAQALIEAGTAPRPGVLERVRRWWAGDPQ